MGDVSKHHLQRQRTGITVNRSIHTTVLAALALVCLPAAASAHVTLQPEEAPAGDFKRLDVRVPNERDNASTKKVEVKFPPGFIFVSYEPVAGWSTRVKMAKLDTPVEAFGEQHSEQVDTITFTADGGGIEPGQFRDFGLSVGLPDTPDKTLTFKALQTYSNGEVVRWIGAPDADEPAPQVKLTAAAAEGHSATPAAGQTTATDDDEDESDTLAIIALIVGGLGLLAGIAGLVVARRARGTATA
jgi:uncharacterized protein